MFEELERIAYQFRDRIFQEGDVSNCAYLIESGAVEISVHRENRPFKVSTLEKGDLFGEMALIDNQPRTATAIALNEVNVCLASSCSLINIVSVTSSLMQAGSTSVLSKTLINCAT